MKTHAFRFLGKQKKGNRQMTFGELKRVCENNVAQNLCTARVALVPPFRIVYTMPCRLLKKIAEGGVGGSRGHNHRAQRRRCSPHKHLA